MPAWQEDYFRVEFRIPPWQLHCRLRVQGLSLKKSPNLFLDRGVLFSHDCLFAANLVLIFSAKAPEVLSDSPRFTLQIHLSPSFLGRYDHIPVPEPRQRPDCRG